ncbi:Ternary complex factor MIP1, leucine-zipper [Heracleum sosnowskyi]|uniref:Ternary complex factor MIP1, leucine-zipper n=1 Tax=Heracleum sosnowskyi TaxID=360622 RepID=A0AAD8MM66_9APIA|nr:Ternary complex factor MIP1, leucine-zipper [Heracleum sosnowskyi]
MDALIVAKDGERAFKGESGGSETSTLVHPQHKRSKSASGKNDLSRGGATNTIRDHHALPVRDLRPPEKNVFPRSPLHENPDNTSINPALKHRDSLEKDIEQLQSRLQEEKSMRMVLERAMGRASSTLSPGHRHFAAQTKELISEIESLEEEVANREQHVLSLYRTIFEQCVSSTTSEQSSCIASPAHAKNESKKHPSIISSAFCSSKNFPFRPFQALANINGSMKRNSMHSTTRQPSLFAGRSNTHFQHGSPRYVRASEQLPGSDKTSMLRTLKEHLHQCPSKLSEEMVKCMAAVYCWLRSSESTNPEKYQSPISLRPSTNDINPKYGIGEEREQSSTSMVEISWISTDKNNFSRASRALNSYRVLVEQLEKVNLDSMEMNAKTAFWINVYNSLIMHAYLAYGIPRSSIRRLALFYKAAYNIGGHIISANAIEQSIFCFSTARVGRWIETILSTAFRKRSGDERQRIKSKYGLQIPQPLVCFALCTGSVSDPVLKVYTASNIKEELDMAKKEFLQANIIVKKSKKVFLPKVLERYAKEASISPDDLLQSVANSVDKKLHDSIHKCIVHSDNKKASQVTNWLPYSSKFRYVFSKNLTEKPWWV